MSEIMNDKNYGVLTRRTDGKSICLNCLLFNGRGCILNLSALAMPTSCGHYQIMIQKK